jgi:hypothetical protein
MTTNAHAEEQRREPLEAWIVVKVLRSELTEATLHWTAAQRIKMCMKNPASFANSSIPAVLVLEFVHGLKHWFTISRL